jgi:hypothetical protein
MAAAEEGGATAAWVVEVWVSVGAAAAVAWAAKAVWGVARGAAAAKHGESSKAC